MISDSCLNKVLHDISNSVSVLNFYVELLKSGDQTFSLQELDEINYNILVQLNVLKFAFQEDICTRIEEYLVAYVAHKNKKLIIKAIDAKYMRFVTNLLLVLVSLFIKSGSIEVNVTENLFSIKLLGKLRESVSEIIASFNSEKSNIPNISYIMSFLIDNKSSIVGNFIADGEFEIKLKETV